MSTKTCAADPAWCARAVHWQAKARHDLERRVAKAHAREVIASIHVAAIVEDVPVAPLLAVARCESSFNPFAVNGRYHGVFQLGGFHLDDPIFAWLPWSDPLANALHTARYVAAHGWSHGQWECYR